MKKLVRELFNCIGKHKILFMALVLLSLFVSFISLYIPLLVADTIDFIVDKNNVNIEKALFYLMIIAIFSIICFLCQYLYDFLNSRMTILITHDLRDRYIKKINSVSIRYLDKNTKGDLISRLINDVELIGEGLLLGTTHI